MRRVKDCNPNKRGCHFCADTVKRKTDGFCVQKLCIHNKCPYHELDDVKSYMEYDKKVRKSGENALEAYLKKLFSLSEK